MAINVRYVNQINPIIISIVITIMTTTATILLLSSLNTSNPIITFNIITAINPHSNPIAT